MQDGVADAELRLWQIYDMVLRLVEFMKSGFLVFSNRSALQGYGVGKCWSISFIHSALSESRILQAILGFCFLDTCLDSNSSLRI